MECNKFKNKPIEDKIKIVKEQRLCWNCSSKGHVLKDCKSQHRRKVKEKKTPEASTNKLATSEVNQTTYLQLLPVIVSHGKDSVSSVTFLDSGSASTLIFKSLADKLQLSGKEQNLRKLPKHKIDIEDLKGSCQHLCDLDFNSVNDNDAAILVGADFQKLHLYRHIKIGKDHEPIAIQSTLGWVLLGGKDNNQNFISGNSFASFVSPTLDKLLKISGKLNLMEPITKKIYPPFQRKNKEQFRLYK